MSIFTRGRQPRVVVLVGLNADPPIEGPARPAGVTRVAGWLKGQPAGVSRGARGFKGQIVGMVKRLVCQKKGRSTVGQNTGSLVERPGPPEPGLPVRMPACQDIKRPNLQFAI